MPRGKQNAIGFYAITRQRYGWEVRLTRDKVLRHRQFNFSEYEGEQGALEAARTWRDVIAALYPPAFRMDRAGKLISSNVSGVAGVTVQYGKDGLPKLWLAKTYLGPGNILRKSFGVAVYGIDARTLAVAERAMQLKLMTGIANVHPSEPVARNAGTAPKAMPAANKPNKAELLRSSNRTGAPGVVRRKGRPGHLGYYTAQTTIGARWVSKSFSVQTYGEEGAKALAVEERARQVQQHAAL